MGKLVLTRRKGETLIIGTGPNRVVVEVAEIRGDKIRLSIEAAKEVPIVRGELETRGEAKLDEG